MKNTFYIIIAIVLIASFVWFGFLRDKKEAGPILSFEDCASAGYPIMESFPRQCKTPDGRTFAEEIVSEITYKNADADKIKVELPFPGAVVGKDFAVIGEARGPWFFEASFPIEVLGSDGKVLSTAIAQAQNDPKTGEINWMTEDFVPFRADIKVPQSYIGPATLLLKKDNPSGLPENDASISFPITIEY